MKLYYVIIALAVISLALLTALLGAVAQDDTLFLALSLKNMFSCYALSVVLLLLGLLLHKREINAQIQTRKQRAVNRVFRREIHDTRSILGEVITATELSDHQDENKHFKANAGPLYHTIVQMISTMEMQYGLDFLSDMEEIKSHIYHMWRKTDNQNLKILIAEDNALNLEMTRLLFTKLGYKDIQSAVDGQQAIDIIEAQPTIRLVVLDYVMPDMNGVEVCKHIHSLYEGIEAEKPIIVGLTGSFTPAVRKKAIAAGMKQLFAKPLMTSTVEHMLALCNAPDSESSLNEMLETAVAKLRSANLSDEQKSYLNVIDHSGHRLIEVLERTQHNKISS